MSKVNVNLGYTINLGDFESYRVQIGVEDDSKPDENTEETFNRIYKFVESRLEQKVKEVKADL